MCYLRLRNRRVWVSSKVKEKINDERAGDGIGRWLFIIGDGDLGSSPQIVTGLRENGRTGAWLRQISRGEEKSLETEPPAGLWDFRDFFV